MLYWILDFLLTGLAILILATLLPGVQVKNYGTALWVTFLISILDVTIGAILRFFAWPFNWLTLGLLYFFIYVFIIYLVDKLVDKFKISGFIWTVIFALLLSLAGEVIDWLLF
jgi:putative membrane protein